MAGEEWPTLRGSNARHGYYPRFPDGPLRLAWRQDLHRELTGPRAEVIVAAGRAYLGTYAGKLYAWDAASGKELWTFSTNGLIWHSPCHHDGRLFVASTDRFLYALDAATGRLSWKFEAKEVITDSPTVAGELVLFGDRGGTWYGVKTANGDRVLEVVTQGPILTPTAITEDGSAAVFASEDMHVYCVELPTGRPRWKSRKMAGLSCRDYPPVVASGLVFVGTNPVRDFHRHTLNADDEFLVSRTGFKGKDRHYVPGTAQDVEREQEAIVRRLKQDPTRQTFHAFRLRDGKEPWIAPVLYAAGLHNPPPPPCVNSDTGELFVILRSAYSVWDGGSEVRAFTTIGRLNPETGRVTLIEHQHPPREKGRPSGSPDLPFASFNLISDETQSLSCAPGLLFSNHQGTLGQLNLKTGRCRVAWGKRDTYAGFFGPGTFGWEQDGGEAKAAQAGQPYAIVNEWHGPARGLAAVAEDRVYLHVGCQVICLRAGGKP